MTRGKRGEGRGGAGREEKVREGTNFYTGEGEEGREERGRKEERKGRKG